MSKTTSLLLVATLFAAVAVHSVYSAAADTVALTNSSFYKEKGTAKFIATGDASLTTSTAYTLSRYLIAGKNSKTNYYVYQTNIPTDNTDSTSRAKGGVINTIFRKIDINKLAFVEGASPVTVTGYKWGGSSTTFYVGASVKNNVTLLGVLSPEPNATNPITNIYAYFIDLDKNEKTELLIASGSWTDADTETEVSINGVYSSGGLTVVLYSSDSQTSSGGTITVTLATLKDGKLGATTTVKTITYTTATSGDESVVSFDGTGEDAYVVVQTEDSNGKNTETVYAFTVSDKEIKAGATAPLNTQVETTNTYTFQKILGHPKGRWVAVYVNSTETNDVTTNNLVAKSSNDTTGFKTLASVAEADGTSRSLTLIDNYFGGVVLFVKEGTTSTGGSSVDQYTYSYQTFAGDLTTVVDAKTTYLTTSGKYATLTNPTIARLGDTKAYNMLLPQILYDSSVNPATTTYEGAYFGQLFQKSFGATLQSVLAVCSLMLAALFIF